MLWGVAVFAPQPSGKLGGLVGLVGCGQLVAAARCR